MLGALESRRLLPQLGVTSDVEEPLGAASHRQLLSGSAGLASGGQARWKSAYCACGAGIVLFMVALGAGLQRNVAFRWKHESSNLSQHWVPQRLESVKPDHQGASWSVYPHYDFLGRADVEEMDAADIGAVMQYVEQRGYSGFSLQGGRAHLKLHDRQLTESDLQFQGDNEAVTFFLHAPQQAVGLPSKNLTDTGQLDALRLQVAALSGKVSSLSARNLQLESSPRTALSSSSCTERCQRIGEGGRWRFGGHGHECADPITGRSFCHCSHDPLQERACAELRPGRGRKLRDRQAPLQLDALSSAPADPPSIENILPEAAPRQLGSASNTISTYCNASAMVDLHGVETNDDAEASELSHNDLNQLESSILSDVVNELESNNVDKAARDIFSFYMCLRWVPDDMFWRLARQELASDLVHSVVKDKEEIEHAVSKLYQQYKFVPLLCSPNFDVFGETDPEDHTYFRTFKKSMTSLSTWLEKHEEDDVVHNLRKVDEIFCDNSNMNDPNCNAGVAFDTWMNGATSALGDWSWNRKSFNDKWEAMYDIFQSFNADSGENKSWTSNLAEWKRRFPFHSFVHKSDGMPPSESPRANQRFLICFGKRVASELHRRPNGRNLLTDQNNIGCHGFWNIGEMRDMIARMVELWKPPTCQLAEMTFVMKKRMLSMYQHMNERLFNALPTLLMDEDLTESGLLAAHIAGPQPYAPQKLTLDGAVFVDGMRVKSKRTVKEPRNCKKPGDIRNIFSRDPDCQLYVPKGGYGTVAIKDAEVRVVWDAYPSSSDPLESSSEVRVVPSTWGMADCWENPAQDLVAGISTIVDKTKEYMDGMSRSRYTNLANLMSNSTSKWVVCPVRGDADMEELDSQLGVEDAAFREHQQEAYAKWTGYGAQLPGEQCAASDLLPDAAFPQGLMCEIAELHADHVERYTNDDGTLEQFLCPAKLSLPAAEQLEVLRKKGGTCLLHMTPSQQRQHQWPYNGNYPARRQFDRKPNLPKVEFELIKILRVPASGNVSYARTCSPDERVASPRFCRAPKLYNTWPTLAGAAKALLESTAGSLGMGSSAIAQSIHDYKKTLSQDKNASELLEDTASLVGEQMWDQLTGAGRLLTGAVSDAVSSVEQGLPGAGERIARMEAGIFQSSEPGLLLHTLSYQKSIGANGQTSNAKERYTRFVTTMPCPGFDPAMEFAVKKRWTTIALRMILSASKASSDVLDAPAVELALRGEGRLFFRENEQASQDTWFTYGAAMQAVSSASAGKAPSLPNCYWHWSGCHPADRCTRSGISCVPKVRLAQNKWWSVLDRELQSAVAPTMSAGNYDVTELQGITAAMYCGEKRSFNDDEPGPKAQTSLLDCLKAGVRKNAELHAEQPWKLYWPEEVAVAVVFGAVTERQCKLVGNETARAALCASGAKEMEDLDLHVPGADKHSSDGAYQGLHAGAGFPQGTPHEVFLRPEDVLEAVGLLSRA